MKYSKREIEDYEKKEELLKYVDSSCAVLDSLSGQLGKCFDKVITTDKVINF